VTLFTLESVKLRDVDVVNESKDCLSLILILITGDVRLLNEKTAKKSGLFKAQMVYLAIPI